MDDLGPLTAVILRAMGRSGSIISLYLKQLFENQNILNSRNGLVNRLFRRFADCQLLAEAEVRARSSRSG
jgi:hypothetical protein